MALDARMLEFRPTRASPPARPPRNIRPKSPTDLSFRSEQQLKNLSAEEVDFLDAVFERAGPTAVGFMAIFDSYNRVLEERGLAPDEVVGYAKLLKVGNWKGETWREKWTEVKNKFGYSTSRSDHATASQGPVRNIPMQSRSGHARKRIPPVLSDAATDVPQYHNTSMTPFRRGSPSPSEATMDSIEPNPLLRSPRHARVFPLMSGLGTMSEVASVTEDNEAPSTTPPSYRTTEKEKFPLQTKRAIPAYSNQRIGIKPKAPLDASSARRVVAAARERKGSVVNEDEAWKKIQMERDEKEAAQFYQDRLTERSWYIWTNAYQWIIVTSRQIDEARDSLIMRIFLQRWRKHLTSRQSLRERAMQVINTNHCKRFFDLWIARFKEKQREKWRHNMRTKLQTMRDKQGLRLLKDSWAKWRHLHRLRLAAHRFDGQLTATFFKRWKSRFWCIDKMETLADEAVQYGLQQLLIQNWTRWKRALQLSFSEKVLTEQVSLKILKNSLTTWRMRTADSQAARTFYHCALLKHSLKSWKAARDRQRRMLDKATKQMTRQDDLLLRAVLRVWKARERGMLLERVIHMRYLRNSLTTWEMRLRELRSSEELANLFARRPQSSSLIVALRTWRRRVKARQYTYAYAEQYHAMRLLDRTLFTWRIVLRDRLKRAKFARIADKFFAARRAWRCWRFQMDGKRRETLLKEWRVRQLKGRFSEWAQRANQMRGDRISVEVIQNMIAKRLLQRALSRWTTVVIEIKSRELEVSHQYDLSVQATAFKQWKALCIRHAEELSLMESYRYVKREEYLRKFFHRWIAAMRMTRRRRITLRENEDEFNLVVLIKSWDKWRDRFVEEKLRVLEHDFVSDGRRNLLFRTFGLWHSKTKSLPALRFRATQLKSKYFAVWCSALPSALQAKKAREVYQKIVLTKFMERWVDIYRSKVALQAVARARYLRLPTSAPRLNNSSSRTGLPGSAPLKTFQPRAETPDDFGPSISALLSKPNNNDRARISGLLRARTRHDASPTRSSATTQRQREVSPARSTLTTKSGDEVASSRLSGKAQTNEKRGSLWLELREVQRRSRRKNGT
ncbi:hypothetical protein M378DRAFT_156912 [Amanita muscaria Koide BX008]|uniref:Sfi1 spindle body domain-containing protein n=1 Tax=Amanita muscaria (strain Koide BX008) TaxID=946122 RepID=A0A0C2XKS8_AMAMK|nr:hypothetical protein M378DRAFT_156912 [Amanita muscaria Koide BX008]